jgi:hypothetical protein
VSWQALKPKWGGSWQALKPKWRGSWQALKPKRPWSASRDARTVALGYVSVREHSKDGQDLQEQTAAIFKACHERGLVLQKVIRDLGQTDATVSRRPGMHEVLRRLTSHDATCLVVAGIERLNCTASELSRISAWLRHDEARLVAVDEGIDTGAQLGGGVADKLLALGAVGGQSAANGAARGPQPTAASNGARAPVSRQGSALQARMSEMRASGMTLREIADRLNAEKVSAPNERPWRPSSVRAAIGSAGGEPQKSGRTTSHRKEGAIR